MASVLFCAYGSAGTGTAHDLVPLVRALVARGHRVTVLAGEDARGRFAELDVDFRAAEERPLPVSAQRQTRFLRRGAELLDLVRTAYVARMERQWTAVKALVAEAAVDVVVTDGLFLGAAVLAFLPRSERPAVIDLGTFPLPVPDAIVPAYGLGIAPTDSLVKRLETAWVGLAAARSYLRLTRAFASAVERLTGVRASGDIRAACLTADVWAQLTVEGFDYPRASVPANVRYIGAPRPDPVATVPD